MFNVEPSDGLPARDVKPLPACEAFMVSAHGDAKACRFDPDRLQRTSDVSRPGNVRELQNLIERAMILSRRPVLEVPLAALQPSADAATTQLDVATLEAIERQHILRVLRASNRVIGGATGASARLGPPRTTLHNKLRKLGIARPHA